MTVSELQVEGKGEVGACVGKLFRGREGERVWR
jgi:hypothetical protein